jgi:hypothetical protein
MSNVVNIDFRQKSHQDAEELSALATMLMFAKETAMEKEASLAGYLIGLAIAALKDDTRVSGRDMPTARN